VVADPHVPGGAYARHHVAHLAGTQAGQLRGLGLMAPMPKIGCSVPVLNMRSFMPGASLPSTIRTYMMTPR